MKTTNTLFYILFCLLFSVTPEMSGLPSFHKETIPAYEITSDRSVFRSTQKEKGKFSIEINNKENVVWAYLPFPVTLKVKTDKTNEPAEEEIIESGYDTIQQTGNVFMCHAMVQSKNGSRFKVEDEIFINEQDLFTIHRKVTVMASHQSDEGFSSKIAIRKASCNESFRDFDLFAPGIIYRTNTYNNRGPANPDLKSSAICLKETHFGLPMFFVRDPTDKVSFSLAHVSPEISTGINEYKSNAWIVNPTVEYGSLGLSWMEEQQNNTVEIDYTYPSADKRQKRSHPVKTGFSHAYKISIYVSEDPLYTGAATKAYKKHFGQYDIPLYDIDMKEVYTAQLDMFYRLAGPIQDETAYGVPWSLSVPEGIPHAFELQNGFVGRQTTIAYQLMRYGLEQERADIFEKGFRMADFWFNDKQLVEYGLPRSWWIQGTKEDGYGNKYTGTFWSYPSFLRCATDGMEGLLDCVKLAHEYNLPEKEKWMEIVQKFGKFLLFTATSEGDGSFYRAYDPHGNFVQDVKVMGPDKHEQNKLQADSKTNTLIPVRFLLEMYKLTNDSTYFQRALQAGEYGYTVFYQELGLFIGGTPDHANVCDKEAGVYAMYAFVSLYQATQDKKWLEAAEYAAMFAFSHTYCYDFRIQGDEKENIFKEGGVMGQSIISTGTSDSDNYNAFIYYELYKMFLLTGDPFYKKAAQLLEKNTKQIMDIDGSKGYAYPALLLEASTFCDFTFSSVKAWLPWCGVANSDPIIKFYQTFGVYNISDLENRNIEELNNLLRK